MFVPGLAVTQIMANNRFNCAGYRIAIYSGTETCTNLELLVRSPPERNLKPDGDGTRGWQGGMAGTHTLALTPIDPRA